MANVSSSNGLEKYPKLRFPGFEDPWQVERLCDFAVRVTRKNSGGESDLPLTISSKDGLVDQVSYFNKTVASKDMSGYYLLYNGEFAYNKSYSVGYDFGSIKRLDRYSMGALSTLYICFALKKHDSDFIKAYFDSLKWYREIYMISAEGARNHGLLNVPTEEFFDTKHHLPTSLAEQRKIAAFLIALDKRIAAQQALVENLKKYKRGLLRATFTQEVLLTNSATWERRKFSEIASLRRAKYTPSRADSRACVELEHIEQQTGRLINYVDSAEQNSIKSVFKRGDVLFGKLRPYLRKYCLPQFDGVCSSEIWVLVPEACVVSEYLFYLVQSDEFLATANISSGTKMPRAEWSKVSNEDYFIPPISEQKRIARMLSIVDHRITTANEMLSALERMRKSFLQQVFI